MRQFTQDPNDGTLGFQIAPMIDVVFVIMLFFMVMAGAVKVEAAGGLSDAAQALQYSSFWEYSDGQ